jgi:hypothetical protein
MLLKQYPTQSGKASVDTILKEINYQLHNRDLPLSRPTSRRNAWGLIPVIKA